MSANDDNLKEIIRLLNMLIDEIRITRDDARRNYDYPRQVQEVGPRVRY